MAYPFLLPRKRRADDRRADDKRRKKMKQSSMLLDAPVDRSEGMSCGLSLSDGTWQRSNIHIPSFGEPCTFINFTTLKAAKKQAKVLDRIRHKNVPSFIAIMKRGNGGGGGGLYQIVVRRVPGFPFHQWLEMQKNNKDVKDCMWTLHKFRHRFVEMENRFRRVFKSIAKVLFYLHKNNIAHGNLLNGVWVSSTENPKVMLINFNTSLAFGEGFKNDMTDLRRLLEVAVQNHSKHEQYSGNLLPPALGSFYNLHEQLFSYANEEEKMRKFAHFLYWAPLFWSWRDGCKFFHRIDDFGDHFFPDESAIAELKDWNQRVKALHKKDPLRMIYEEKQYAGGLKGLFRMHRNTLRHYSDTCEDLAIEEAAKKGKKELVKSIKPCSDRVALKDLISLFPEGIPLLYESMIKTLFEVFGEELIIALNK